MEAQQGSTDDTAPEQPAARGDHQEVPPRAGWEDDKARIGRGLAFFCLIGSLTGLTLGVAFYGRYAPRVDILTVELAGAGAPPMTDDEVAAVWLDFGLIFGYGVFLALAMVLATGIFRTSTARTVARQGWRLTAVVVTADVLENVLLLSTSGQTLLPDGLLRAAAASAAVLKFVCAIPAGAIAATAVVVTAVRLWSHRPASLELRRCRHVTVEPADPLEGDPPAPVGRGGRRAEGRSRWRRGYQLPDLEVADQRLPVIGFCLSGGGIRSASVALGALQSLRAELLKARFLVSVSGGGYTAGALQLALTGAETVKDPPGPTVIRDPLTAYLPGSAEEDRVRRHARYLADSPAELVVALGVIARVLVLSLAVLFAPAVVLGAAVGLFYEVIPIASTRSGAGALQIPQIPEGTYELLIALLVLAVGTFMVTLASAAYSTKAGAGDRIRGVAQGITSLGLLVGLVGVAIPWLVVGAGWLLEDATAPYLQFGPVIAVVVTYGVTIASFVRQKKVFDSVGGLFSTGKKKEGASVVGAVPGGALQLIMVVLVLTLLAAGWLLLAAGVAAQATGASREATLRTAGVVLLVLLLLGGLLDQTALSLHPFYRRRLAGAFASRRVQRPDGDVLAEGYPYSERTELPKYGAGAEGFPEVVFAAAANLTGEKRAPLKATSFTFTSRWLGGPDVGYVNTAELQAAVRPPFLRDLTVQAAVAISGAAFASATGRATRWYTTLLAVTGLRLGTWLPNPAFVERWNEAAVHDDWTRPGLPRLRRLSYLLREVVGSHRFTDRLLQVTDGGHYENLGLVEALRRRCTEIYCIDASGDAPPTAGTLAEAITLAQAELGVRIRLSDDVWRLVPGSGRPLAPHDPLSALNKRLSDRAVITGVICYPAESDLPEGHRHGVLVVAKARLTPRMDYALLSYAARKSVFPYDTTGDQFFDDGQFTAYASLGRQIGCDAEEAMEAQRKREWSKQPCPFEARCLSSDADPAGTAPGTAAPGDLAPGSTAVSAAPTPAGAMSRRARLWSALTAGWRRLSRRIS